MNGEARKQEDALAAKLAARRNRTKYTDEQLRERCADAIEQIEQLEGDKDTLLDKMPNVFTAMIGDQKLKDKVEKEKRKKAEEIDRQKDKQMGDIREEYMKRLGLATTDSEKEGILEEMERRQKLMAAQLEKDKREAQKNLEKQLQARHARKLAKKEKHSDKAVQAKEDLIESLEDGIEREKARIYSENGGGMAGLDVLLKKKINETVGKAFDPFSLELTKDEMEQVDVLRVQQ